jgi:hypothetical protein
MHIQLGRCGLVGSYPFVNIDERFKREKLIQCDSIVVVIVSEHDDDEKGLYV